VGLKPGGANTAGEILAAVATTPPGTQFDMFASSQPGYWTNPAAEGWDGDRFYLLRNGDGEPAGAIWITIWDSAADRDEFVAAYEGTPAGESAETWLAGERAAVFTYGGASQAGHVIQDALLTGEGSLLR
jgi:hypothetical protein